MAINQPIAAPLSLYEQLEIYPWSTDLSFQSGLSSILSRATSRSQIEELTLRARCFYYTRKYNTPIEYEGYMIWRATRLKHSSSHTSTSQPLVPQATSRTTTSFDSSHQLPSPHLQPTNGHKHDGADKYNAPTSSHSATSQPQQSQPDHPSNHPPSFDEIMQLIQSGQPIPGIKDIPDTVLLGRGTQASSGRRRKPWETGESTPQSQSSSLELQRRNSSEGNAA